MGLPDESDFEQTRNHYDDSKLSKRATHDLESDPGEDVAMFFGLEVIDGSHYHVTTKGTTKKVIFHDAQPDSAIDAANRGKQKGIKRTLQAAPSPEGSKDLPEANETGKIESKSPDREDCDPVISNSRDSQRNAVSTENIKPKRSKSKKLKDKEKEVSRNDSNMDPILVSRLQNSWMTETGGVLLKESICERLMKQGFERPTPIQAATLAASILGRRNIVGAAPTGSGKTLAYLLPILQELNEESVLQALILTPTRELALQVSQECSKLAPKSCGTLVGGLALAKQARVLTQRPPILVATAGRLWELMSSKEHLHLNELSKIRFLVVDEADRMIQQGSFPQLVKILDAIHDANPLYDEGESEDDEDDDDDEDRMSGLPGIPGEAKVVMLGDLMERINQQKGYAHQILEEINDEIENTTVDNEEKIENRTDLVSLTQRVNRQTFVFSATLTLPPSESYIAKQGRKSKKKNVPKNLSIDGAIAEILERTRSHGKTKVVDLTSSDNFLSFDNKEATATDKTGKQTKAFLSAESSRLPPGLSLLQIQCTQKHKDSHLYAYLVTTTQGGSGPCLIFCNSIAGVRRVGSTLQTLRLPVRMLHANMPQKARFKAVESIQQPKSRDIVVATDVAARGLDIPSVATVVHYDVARQVDTFIHRAGRTARGMGVGAVGSSLSLVAPGEDKAQDRICKALGSKRLFQGVPLDGRLLSEAQARVNLASKIVECEDLESRTRKQNQWFQKLADEAGLEVDDGLIEDGLAGGDKREQQQLQTALQARSQLRILLAQPMTTQRFGKFLSCNSAALDLPISPHVVPLSSQNKKRKRQQH